MFDVDSEFCCQYVYVNFASHFETAQRERLPYLTDVRMPLAARRLLNEVQVKLSRKSEFRPR